MVYSLQHKLDRFNNSPACTAEEHCQKEFLLSTLDCLLIKRGSDLLLLPLHHFTCTFRSSVYWQLQDIALCISILWECNWDECCITPQSFPQIHTLMLQCYEIMLSLVTYSRNLSWNGDFKTTSSDSRQCSDILNCACIAGCRVFEGDICVTDEEWKHLNSETDPPKSVSDSQAPQTRPERAVVKREFMKWIDGVVPYALAPTLSEFKRNLHCWCVIVHSGV